MSGTETPGASQTGTIPPPASGMAETSATPFPPAFLIGERWIGSGQPPFIVAELSGNHGGDPERAHQLLEAAYLAGADAVKLQTYHPDRLTLAGDGPGFRLEGGLWAGQTLHQLYTRAQTPWDWHPGLFAHARQRGLCIFSAPFDPEAVDLLETLAPPAYKIASYELVDLPLIAYAARTGRPLILSTGLADLGEIAAAVETARAAGCPALALLHCVSGYPTPPEESDLRTLPHLGASFGVPAGLSDHSPGLAVPVAAVALGAAIIEKHLTLNRADGGVDAAFSLEPEAFRQMATACRTAAAALGRINYTVKPSEQGGRLYRRSLYVVADMAAGEAFTPQTLRSIRPGFGLAPRHLPQILGRRAARPLRRGEPLTWAMLAPEPEPGPEPSA